MRSSNWKWYASDALYFFAICWLSIEMPWYTLSFMGFNSVENESARYSESDLCGTTRASESRHSLVTIAFVNCEPLWFGFGDTFRR